MKIIVLLMDLVWRFRAEQIDERSKTRKKDTERSLTVGRSEVQETVNKIKGY
jgi:hypothetical protein